MSYNFAIIIGTPAEDMSCFMEENAHAVSARKLKRIGYTSSTVRHWMRATTETPHGKKSRMPCKCGDSRKIFGQLLKRDYITYPLI
jgi:hypothetical protein